MNFSSQPTKNNDEIDKLLAAQGATFPAKLEAGKGYILMVETIGDAIRAIIDGKPAGFLSSLVLFMPPSPRSNSASPPRTAFFDDIRTGQIVGDRQPTQPLP